ncbi:hypothetical protein, conserved [Plasmodium ovale wallikeri]|uniref:Uncharacterized protein n=2 Tax=Plasmodium ovale TaxID=36330 RepID=A0A1A9A123_PLAOA|nr:hypothetical protein, conserved [Plasmodium ovale wallikeri]SBT49840.1 hypothetical protein, conserved [Plasmodium ovale wallikeri]SBT82644.1 conserved Plasmodium protein, unknown function [Plasmodium ovale]
MLWEYFSGIANKLLGKQGLKEFVPKFREVKQTFKIVFDLTCRGVFSKVLNKQRIKFINIYAKYVYNNVVAKLCNSFYKTSNFKIHTRDFVSKNKIISRKIEKCAIAACYNKKKKGGIIKNDANEYTKDMHGLEQNDHYIIDLYNETHLQTEQCNSFLLKNKIPRCESNYNTTQSSDCGKTNESDEINSISCLENDMLSFETLEYDEDEVNESIKNCYLYNGYINASTYKNSDEYKFLKHHLDEEKNHCLNIEIDIPSQGYDEQVESEHEEKEIWIQADHGLDEIDENKRKKKKKKIYEIYNTETTMIENMYCENYLNENYSSSYESTSEDSDDIDGDDYTDGFEHSCLEDIYENDFLCHSRTNSYDTIEST